MFCPSVPDEFNTLRSGGAGSQSHVTEVSSVMTANVSDPATSGSANGGQQQQLTSVADTNSQQPPTQPCQMSSPPQPVSTLQHNYSNIQQPAPLVSNKRYLNQALFFNVLGVIFSSRRLPPLEILA